LASRSFYGALHPFGKVACGTQGFREEKRKGASGKGEGWGRGNWKRTFIRRAMKRLLKIARIGLRIEGIITVVSGSGSSWKGGNFS